MFTRHFPTSDLHVVVIFAALETNHAFLGLLARGRVLHHCCTTVISPVLIFTVLDKVPGYNFESVGSLKMTAFVFGVDIV